MIFDWFRNRSADPAILRRNIRWCTSLFGHLPFVTEGVPAYLEKQSTAKLFLAATDLKYSHRGWAYLCEHLSSYPAAEQFFLSTAEGETVVGYELSTAQKRALDEAGKRFIDLRTHPVRFLPDYFFAAATNDADLHARLSALAPDRCYVDRHATLICARAQRATEKPINPEVGIVLFLQTAVDTSRMRDGFLIDDMFLLGRFREVVARHAPENIYFKCHPHERAPAWLLSELQRLGARETKTPTYNLLAVEGLRTWSLSSSISREAAYFPSASETFLEPVDMFPTLGEPTLPGDYLMLPANVTDPHLWNYLFNGGLLPDCVFPEEATPFRASSGLKWG